MTDILTTIRSFPRDTTLVIEGNAALAHALHDQGHPVVLVGAESAKVLTVPNPDALNDMWSILTCRNPAAVGLGGPELRAVVQAASDRSSVNVKTSNFRARGWAEHFIRNLKRLTCPLAMTLRGLDGVPAFIVGAGSNLDRNHHLLPECAKRGIVIGVNAAARLHSVDVALTVESNDLRHKLGPLGHVSMRAFATSADPVLMDHGKGQLVVSYAGELGDLAASITGAPKLACSASGSTAAVSLAERLGCDPIVLVGHDFEIVDGALMYAACLGLGDSRVHRREGSIGFTWDPTLAALKRHNPLHEAEAIVEVPTYDGGTTVCSAAFAGNRAWYGSVGAAVGDHVTLVNATEGNVPVDGWERWTLRETVNALPPCEYVVSGTPGVTEERPRAWVASHLEGIRRVEHCARDGDVKGLMVALRFAPLVEPWCQHRIAEIMASRRSEPPSQNVWCEWRTAKRHEGDILAAILAELPTLVSELDRCLDAAG